MTDQVSVRLAVVGGTQFRNEMNAAGQSGTQAMNRMTTAARGVSPAFNAVAIQAGAMAARMAGASPVATGLSSALGMAVAGASAFGIAGGVAVAVLGAMVPLMLKGRDSVAAMSAEFEKQTGSIAKVDGAMAALRKVQGEYRDAVKAQGGAASAAAASVVAASRREFEARKSVLEMELQILRTRGTEDGISLREKQAQFGRESEVALQSGQGLRYQGLPDPTGFAARRRPGRNAVLDGFLARNAGAVQDMAVLRGREFERELAIRRAQTALETEFMTAGGITVGDPPGKGGGAGRNAQNKLLEEGKRLFDQTRTAAEKYATEMARLNELLKAGAIDQDTYNRRTTQLRAGLESAGNFAAGVAGEVKSSLSSLFDAVFEGGTKAGEVIESLGKKLASMALQESVFRLLAQLAPGVFGAGGFVPLIGGAGAVPSFNGGGWTGNGARSGGLDGRGGFMAMLHPREQVIDTTRGRPGGGSTFILNDMRGAGAPAIDRETRQGPDGREIVIATVRDATQRGEMDGAQGRFGARPTKVRR